MGLDMYLSGEKYLKNGVRGDEERIEEDGFPLMRKIFELGYWRKNADLHGFIVKNFADDGIDDCKEIGLGPSDLKAIIKAVKDTELPHTEGFFFRYDMTPEEVDHQRQEDLFILKKALAWAEYKEDGVWRSITYQASW